jgi:hypothetical protein
VTGPVYLLLLVGGSVVHHLRKPRRYRHVGHRGVMVIDSPGLPEGYVPPSASLTPPVRGPQRTAVTG